MSGQQLRASFIIAADTLHKAPGFVCGRFYGPFRRPGDFCRSKQAAVIPLGAPGGSWFVRRWNAFSVQSNDAPATISPPGCDAVTKSRLVHTGCGRACVFHDVRLKRQHVHHNDGAATCLRPAGRNTRSTRCHATGGRLRMSRTIRAVRPLVISVT